MTRDDPFSPYRPLIEAAIGRELDALSFSYAELLREEIGVAGVAGGPDGLLAAPALCLLTVDASGGRMEAAAPAAAGLALLEATAQLFKGLAKGESLAGAWGFPRALNAGDAMFALAQSSLLRSTESEPEEARALAAAGLFDLACRRLSQALYVALDGLTPPVADPQAPLLALALALGALLGGAESTTADLLAAAADRPALREALAAAPLSAGAKARLVEALDYLAEVAAP